MSRVIIVLFLFATTTAFADPPNILLIVSDDQRPDTIHALGSDIIQTPNLAGWCSRGAALRERRVRTRFALPAVPKF